MIEEPFELSLRGCADITQKMPREAQPVGSINNLVNVRTRLRQNVVSPRVLENADIDGIGSACFGNQPI